jgi:hypothetical protein
MCIFLDLYSGKINKRLEQHLPFEKEIRELAPYCMNFSTVLILFTNRLCVLFIAIEIKAP